MRETKAAVIGLGFMGKVHCENIRRLPYVKLQAIVTRNEGSSTPFASITDSFRWFRG